MQCLLIITVLIAQALGGYIITSPNSYKVDQNSTVCVTLTNLDDPDPVDITLTLLREPKYHDESLKVLDTKTLTVDPESTACTELMIISSLADNAVGGRLNVTGVQQDSTLGSLFYPEDSNKYTFTDSVRISIKAWSSGNVTFIQTDKPIYKPGQKVKFRVLSLNGETKPINDKIDRVIINSPSGTRVDQWLDVQPMKGLSEFNFQLSDEPEQGEWEIEVKRGDAKDMQTFKVEEYVLPKFEVTMDPPTFLTMKSQEVPVKVCAKYTYGEPVKGESKLTACYQKGHRYMYWTYKENEQTVPCAVQLLDLDSEGCSDYMLTPEQLGFSSDDDFEWGTKLDLTARVEERDTGIVLNATDATVEFYEHDITIEYVGRGNFKPGIPYNAKAVVKYRDDTPAAGKLIEVRVDNFREGEAYIQNYTSNEIGEVKFSIPPVLEKRAKFTIQINAIDYEKNQYGYGQPSASQIIKSWWSTSGSYLQFEPVEGVSSCNTNKMMKLHYTVDEAVNVVLNYVIVGPNDIVSTYSTVENLTPDYEVGSQSEDSDWDKTDVKDNRWWNPYPYIVDDLIMEVDPIPETTEMSENEVERETTTEMRSPPPPTTPPAPVASVGSHFGSKTLTIRITPEMSPGAKVLIYYVRSDGEVVSEQADISVKSCLNNQVEMSFSIEKGLPGDKVSMDLKASPESLCAYGVVDKSVFLQGGDNKLTVEEAVRVLKPVMLTEWSSYTSFSSDYDYCKEQFPSPTSTPLPSPPGFTPGEEVTTNKVELVDVEEDEIIPETVGRRRRSPPLAAKYRRKRSSVPYFRGNSYYTEFDDSVKSFKMSGVAVMTDLTLETRPCVKREYDYDTYVYDDDMVMYGLPGVGRSDAVEMSVNIDSGRDGDQALPKLTVRTEFPESWLWDLIMVDDSGLASVKTELPHTITEWNGNVICMNDEVGLGISERASVTTFQNYFISANLPYSIVRGETVPLSVSVFNYLSECLPVKITLKPSADYDVVSDVQKSVCVCGKDSQLVEFEIEALTIGTINITVTSMMDDADACSNTVGVVSSLTGIRDAVIRQHLVKSEGAPRTESYNDYICLNDGEDDKSESISVDIAQKVADNPRVIVPDSLRGYVSVVGDVMGPAVDNLDSLLRMPWGCGEQNMVGFAPNIYVLEYLTSSGQVTDQIKMKAHTNMKSGYQRELTYKHRDGSYSAFGPNGYSEEPGSSWLTAFVLKCFSQAKPHIYIDEEIINESVEYFREVQDSKGCFPQLGMVHSSYLKGGARGTGESTMTAFVLIALLEAGVDRQDRMVTDAIRCLYVQTQSTLYNKALTTYALSLYDPEYSLTQIAYQELMTGATRAAGQVYWKVEEEEPTSNYNYWYQPSSANIETTSYALLATFNMERTENAKLDKSLPIVSWLSKQRNPFGGFSSTQDTVIGLQALAKFASLVSSDDMDVTVVVRTDGDRGLSPPVMSLQIDSTNSLVHYTEKIAPDTKVEINAKGKGCFLVQANMMYNVKAEKPSTSAFDVNVDVFKSSVSEPCKGRKLHICAKYTGEDDESNMAIVEIGMVSGWSVDPLTVKNLLKTRKIARYEIDQDGTVQLYFDKLTGRSSCFSLELQRTLIVRDAKPAVVRAYDYYKQSQYSEEDYFILTSFCESPKPATKEDLPEVDQETYENSLVQARQPIGKAPWLTDDSATGTKEDLPDVDQETYESSLNQARQPIGKAPWLTDDSATGTKEELPDVDQESYDNSLDQARQPVGKAPWLTDDSATGTKEELPDVDQESYENSLDQARQPVGEAPWLRSRPSCPVCTDEFNPEDICMFAQALKIYWRENSNNPIRLMADLRPNDGKIKYGKFTDFEMDDQCYCSTIYNAVKGSKLMFFGDFENIREDPIKLNSTTTIIHLTRAIESQLVRASRECEN